MAKCVVRPDIFETDSSSSHVFVTTKNDEYIQIALNDYNADDYVYINDEGKIYLPEISEGFGRWPFRVLRSFEYKLSYALCAYLGCYYDDEPEFKAEYQRLLSIVQEIVPEVKDFNIKEREVDIYYDADGNRLLQKQLRYKGYNEERDWYIYVYKNADGEEVEATMDEEYVDTLPDIGSIDHESMDMLQNFLEKKGITLKEFLTNKKYLVFIDGDEYHEFDNMIKSGIIDMDNIEEVYK